MIRVLIVDDEQMEREALQVMIENGLSGVQVAGKAENGKIAVELTEQLRPDLILMDIKMPGMDGLEATRHIVERHPDARIIIVSAYDTFEYARQAMQMGVRDYMLKPSKTGEILATIDKIATEIRADRKARAEAAAESERWRKLAPVLEADVVTQLLYDHAHELDVQDLLPMFGIKQVKEAFVMLLMVIDTDANDSDIHSFYKAVKSEFHRYADGWAGAIAGRKIPMIVITEPNLSYRAQATYLARKIRQLSHRFESCRLFVGVGSQYEQIQQMRQSFYEALIAASNPYLPSGVCFYDDLQSSQTDPLSAKWEEEMAEVFRQGRFDTIRQILDDLIDRCQAQRRSTSETQQRVLEVLFTVSGMMRDIGAETNLPLFTSRIEHYRDLKAEMHSIVDKMAAVHQEMKNRMSPAVSAQVKQYILDHAHERISLDSLAERFGLSPFYISKLFKDQFGKNYIDFLTDCRIEKAKQLMIDANKSLKEIAFDVGYKDPNYFSRVFKKVCGVSAKSYRQQMIGK